MIKQFEEISENVLSKNGKVKTIQLQKAHLDILTIFIDYLKEETLLSPKGKIYAKNMFSVYQVNKQINGIQEDVTQWFKTINTIHSDDHSIVQVK